MLSPDFNVAFVMWRESIEALLVVGILNAWLSARPPEERARGRAWLWAGVAAGLAGAVALAATLLFAGEALGDEGQEYFQMAIMFIAAALIVQMVFWMRRHGRTLKTELHASLDDAATRSHWLGVFVLAALAVLREGAEAAVFLYGTMASASASWWSGAFSAALGFAAAALTYMALQAGGRLLSWRLFFRVTEVMLLLLAGGLVINGLDHLISLGVIPQLSSKLWDTSALLPDSGALGGLVSSLTGYRARPVLVEVLALAAFWISMTWLLKRPEPRTA